MSNLQIKYTFLRVDNNNKSENNNSNSLKRIKYINYI